MAMSRKKKKVGNLNDEWLIDQLNALGFVWDLSLVTVWDKNFEDLQRYKTLRGHCNVGRSDGQEWATLKRWVSTQRSERRKDTLLP
eukprot:scaffold9874_cov51-Cyclotella_meneghiniana.AAC.3